MVSVELWPAATVLLYRAFVSMVNLLCRLVVARAGVVLLHFAGPLRLGRTDKPADYCVLLSFGINYLPLSLARCHKAMVPVHPRPHHDMEMQERKKRK